MFIYKYIWLKGIFIVLLYLCGMWYIIIDFKKWKVKSCLIIIGVYNGVRFFLSFFMLFNEGRNLWIWIIIRGFVVILWKCFIVIIFFMVIRLNVWRDLFLVELFIFLILIWRFRLFLIIWNCLGVECFVILIDLLMVFKVLLFGFVDFVIKVYVFLIILGFICIFKSLFLIFWIILVGL